MKQIVNWWIINKKQPVTIIIILIMDFVSLICNDGKESLPVGDYWSDKTRHLKTSLDAVQWLLTSFTIQRQNSGHQTPAERL